MNRAEQRMGIQAINGWYDRRMFGAHRERRDDFHNFGHWEWDTRTRKEACENLMERLLAFLPEKKGMILDVACGKGQQRATY